jgi:hypothetical protein
MGELTKDEHLALLKRAIAANMRARVEHDLRCAEIAGPFELKVISAQELFETDPNRLLLEGVVEDPVRKALRAQLKDLGWRLFHLLGNTDAMLTVAEEISNMKPGNWHYRIDILDKTWDGIGKEGDWWVA